MGTDANRREQAPGPAALPRRIAVVSFGTDAARADASGTDDGMAARACRLILDDLTRACRVYSAHDAAGDQAAPVMERFELNAAMDAGNERLRGADTWVIGTDATGADVGGTCAERLAGLLRTAGSMQARVYAVAVCSGDDPQAAVHALDALMARAQAAGARPCGGLAVPRAHEVATAFPTARMGRRRRQLSEATDRLILALRCGQDAGTLTVRPCTLRALIRRIARR